MKPAAVVFDLDGTLLDATPAIIDGFFHVLQRHGLRPRAPDEIRRLIGKPLPLMFRELIADEAFDIPRAVEQYLIYSRSLNGRGIRLLPGAEALLARCERHCRIGVNTSRTTASARRVLSRLGVMHLLPEVVGIDQVLHPKPHPEGLSLALSRLGVAPSEGIMLGDTPDDIHAARGAGARAFAVTTGFYGEPDLLAAGAEEVFSSLENFEVRLQELMAGNAE